MILQNKIQRIEIVPGVNAKGAYPLELSPIKGNPQPGYSLITPQLPIVETKGFRCPACSCYALHGA